MRFDSEIIEIHAGNAKTTTRRTVPILPSLRAWLEKVLADGHPRSGPVCSFANVTDQIVSLLTKINRQRTEDGGRSSEVGLTTSWAKEEMRGLIDAVKPKALRERLLKVRAKW